MTAEHPADAVEVERRRLGRAGAPAAGTRPGSTPYGCGPMRIVRQRPRRVQRRPQRAHGCASVLASLPCGSSMLGCVVPAGRLPERIDERRGELMMTAAGARSHGERRGVDAERGGEPAGVGVGGGVGIGARRRGGAHAATCSAGAVEKPQRMLPVLFVGVPGATNARSPDAACPASSASNDAAALLGGQRPVDAEHDEAGQPVGERRPKAMSLSRTVSEHAGRRGPPPGSTAQLNASWTFGQRGDRPSGVVGAPRGRPATGRRPGDRAPGPTRLGTPRHGVLEPDRHPALGQGGRLDRPRPRAGPVAVSGNAGGSPVRSVQVRRSQRVEQVAGPAGPEPAGEGGPGRLGPRRVVERRPPLVPVPLGAGPLVVGERRFVGVEVHLVGEDADVQGGVGIREARLDPHRQQRHRHLAVERLDGGRGRCVQQPGRRRRRARKFGTPRVRAARRRSRSATSARPVQPGAPAGRAQVGQLGLAGGELRPNAVSSSARCELRAVLGDRRGRGRASAPRDVSGERGRAPGRVLEQASATVAPSAGPAAARSSPRAAQVLDGERRRRRSRCRARRRRHAVGRRPVATRRARNGAR